MSNGMTREIQFVNGNLVNVDDVLPELYTISDVAHSLSMLCRYTGHCEHFYSVAQHSVYVSLKVPEHLAMAGLLHDMSESVIGDLSSPIKKDMHDYNALERNILIQMCKKFPFVTYDQLTHPSVIGVDYRMLATEKRDVMRGDTDWPFIEANQIKPFDDLTIDKMDNGQAYIFFMKRFFELSLKLGLT